jgi:hypothetical protein
MVRVELVDAFPELLMTCRPPSALSGPGELRADSSFGLCNVPTVRAICPGAP